MRFSVVRRIPALLLLCLTCLGAQLCIAQEADPYLLRTLTGHTSGVSSVAISPHGGTIVSGSEDNTIKVWRLSDGATLRTVSGRTTSCVLSVAISPDGNTIVSGSADGTIKVWRLADGALLRTLIGHTDWVRSVAISPDGSTIVSGSVDNTIKVWWVADGALLRTLTGHTSDVYGVAISPDGSTIVSGSWDNTIKVWPLSGGPALGTLFGHTNTVKSVAISPDGSTIVSGSDDNTIRVWRMPRAEPSSHEVPGDVDVVVLDERVRRMPGAEPVSAPLTAPPRLGVSASFSDPSDNRALDAYETATLAITVRNTGRGPAANLRAKVSGQLRGVTVTPPDAVPTLAVGRETTINLPLAADGTLRDGAARLRVVVEEAHGFNSDTLAVEFQTRAERPPALALARLGLDDDEAGESFGDGDGRFEPGESVELVAFIENRGTGAAEAVTAQIVIAPGTQGIYLLRPQDGRATVGDIPAGGTAELPLVLSAARTYGGSPTLPVTLTLADRRDRYRWAMPLGLALGTATATVQTMRVEAAAETPVATRTPSPASGHSGSRPAPDTVMTAAVLSLDCPGMSAEVVLGLSDRLRTSLHETGVFTVMERARMESILQEQGFQQSGCVETECAVEIGRLVAVRVMIAGSVARIGQTYSVTLRAFDVEGGQTIASKSGDCGGCTIDRVLTETIPQVAAALAGEVLRRADAQRGR